VSIQVADQRVLWKWGRISGVYNQPAADGSANQELPADVLLRDALLAAPGVSSVNSTAPSYIYPPVAWRAENPASAAQELCEQLHLGISISPSGQVYVRSLDSYNPAFPSGYQTADEATTGNLVKPAKIVVIGAQHIVDVTFEDLIAVGLEIDGTVRPIADLSYAPAHGWGSEPLTFPSLAGGTYGGTAYTKQEAQELARKCIWRWYALDLTDDEREQYLPLCGTLAETATVDGNEEHRPPYVESTRAIFDGTKWIKLDQGVINVPFTLDRAAGLVKFTEPVYTVSTDGASATAIVAPTMDLRAAYEMKWWQDDCHYVYEYNVRGGIAGTEHVHHVPELRAFYASPFPENGSDLDAYAAQIAVKIAGEYNEDGPASRSYPAIKNVTPAGTIRSVQWDVSERGATTVVQKNFDAPAVSTMPSYKEKLRRREQKVVVQKVRDWRANYYNDKNRAFEARETSG